MRTKSPSREITYLDPCSCRSATHAWTRPAVSCRFKEWLCGERRREMMSEGVAWTRVCGSQRLPRCTNPASVAALGVRGACMTQPLPSSSHRGVAECLSECHRQGLEWLLALHLDRRPPSARSLTWPKHAKAPRQPGASLARARLDHPPPPKAPSRLHQNRFDPCLLCEGKAWPSDQTLSKLSISSSDLTPISIYHFPAKAPLPPATRQSSKCLTFHSTSSTT